MSQSSLFDPHDGDRLDAAASRAAAEAGADLVDSNANPHWKDAADDVLHWCARNYDSFTSDQFWRRCANLDLPDPHDRRAFAGVVARAKRAGWITVTNTMTNSERKQAHSSPKRIYVSRLRSLRAPMIDVGARVRSCTEVEVDYVEHVHFDGTDYYLAADLLAALLEGTA